MRSKGLLRIDVKTDSGRRVRTEAKGQILGSLSEAEGTSTSTSYEQVIRTPYSDTNWACNASDRRRTSGGVSHAREPLHQGLEQDSLARYVVFSRVRAIRFGEGERRGAFNPSPETRDTRGARSCTETPAQPWV